MSEDKTSLTPNPLFARKGEAAPAPVVGYVGVTDLRGKLNRRQAQRPFDGGERRHSALDSIVGEVAPDTVEPASQPPPPAAAAGGSLAWLIHRRVDPRPRDPGSRPPPRGAPPQGPGPRAAELPAAATSPSSVEATAKGAKPARKRKRPRRQLTVRFPIDEFARLEALAKETGQTYQDILATATNAYLEQAPNKSAIARRPSW